MSMRPRGIASPAFLALFFGAFGAAAQGDPDAQPSPQRPQATAPSPAASAPSGGSEKAGSDATQPATDEGSANKSDTPAAGDAAVDETAVDEAEVDEATVDEATVDEAAVDEEAPGEGEPGEAAPSDNPYDTPVSGDASMDEFKKRPAPGRSVLFGRITDQLTGEPVAEALLEVADQGVSTKTDAQGRYRLELAPGTYTVTVTCDLFDKVALQRVVLRPNKVLETNVPLAPQEGAIEEVVIEEAGNTESVAGLALARQKSLSAGDAIGREQISKGTDSNAAQAAQRVVGANIVGGRFVYVRGLGERYSNSLLGGYPLPSPEPDRAAVPLDVFPAAVLDSINIQKTFMPDMPGDFAGGSVQIETRSVPRDPFFNFSLSGGINTQSTFQDRLSSRGGSLDFLGFDDGGRSLPDSIPRDRTFGTATDDIEQLGKDVNSSFALHRTSTPIDHGFTAVGGNTYSLGGGQELGFLASVNYSRKFLNYLDENITEYLPSTAEALGYQRRVGYSVDRGIDQVRWGAFGKVTYQPTASSGITASVLHSQLADNASAQFTGQTTDAEVNALQTSWVERGLTFGLLSGRHQVPALNGAELNWDVSIARAGRAEPDRRDNAYSLVRSLLGGSSWKVRGENDSTRHFWSDQVENSGGGKLDYKQPLLSGGLPLTMKVGGLVNLKERRFNARRMFYATNENNFRNRSGTCPGTDFTIDCPDLIFTDQVITDGLELRDGWIDGKGDRYRSHLNVFAGYAMLDTELAKQLRLAAGARLEATEQGITPLLLDGAQDPQAPAAQLSSLDVLPAGSLVLGAHSKMKTRVSYGRTLARPQVRELAPFEFADYFSGRSTVGNPNLKFSQIDNVDFRVEYFPSLAEVLAVSVFFKHIALPIEPYLVPADANPQVTYNNAEQANLIGAEFEARKNLGFLTGALRDFSLNTNLSLSYSRTEVEQTGNNTITNTSRPLVNQSPWVLNVALDYENKVGTNVRVAYNVAGPALVLIGTLGLDDGFLQSIHRVDVSVGQRFLENFKGALTVTNLTNDDYLVTMGQAIRDDNILNQYRQGTQIQLSLGYEFNGAPRRKSEAPSIH